MSGLLARPSNVKDGNAMCRLRRPRNYSSSTSVNSLTKHFSTSKVLDKKKEYHLLPANRCLKTGKWFERESFDIQRLKNIPLSTSHDLQLVIYIITTATNSKITSSSSLSI